MSTHSNNNKHDSEEAIQSDYSIRTENTTKRKSTCEVFINMTKMKPVREVTFTLRVKGSNKKRNLTISSRQAFIVGTQHSFNQV